MTGIHNLHEDDVVGVFAAGTGVVGPREGEAGPASLTGLGTHAQQVRACFGVLGRGEQRQRDAPDRKWGIAHHLRIPHHRADADRLHRDPEREVDLLLTTSLDRDHIRLADELNAGSLECRRHHLVVGG